MSKVNGKSLGSLRQKLRKYMRENVADDVAKFDPEEEDESGDEGEEKDDDDDSDDERPRGKREEKEKVKKPRASMDDGSDSDSDDWGDSDSDSDSDSDAGLGDGVTYTREMFLKKAEDPEKEAKKKEKKDAKDEKRELAKQKQKQKREEEEEDSDASGDEGEGWTKVSKVSKIAMFAADAEITIELVIKKLNEIMAARGKKKTNRKEQIELLNELARIAREHNLGPGVHIKVKFAVIAALFDYNPKLTDAMKPDSWEKCIAGVDNLLDLLAEHADVIITGNLIMDENEVLESQPYKVRGCYLTAVEKLDEEFIKVLKACDAHSNEYVDRLKDEPLVVKILEKAEALILKSGSPSEICRIYLKKIEHIYFKFDPMVIDQKAGKVDASASTSMKVIDVEAEAS